MPRAVFVLLVVVLVSGAIAASPQAPGPRGTLRPVPDALRDTAWIREAAAAQQQALAGAGPAHDFRFTDRNKESGITFIHNIFDDAGKTYNAAHYDHGNGQAAADVDGDGRVYLYFTSKTGGNQ
jgi:hypothetical protein